MLFVSFVILFWRHEKLLSTLLTLPSFNSSTYFVSIFTRVGYMFTSGRYTTDIFSEIKRIVYVRNGTIFLVHFLLNPFEIAQQLFIISLGSHGSLIDTWVSRMRDESIYQAGEGVGGAQPKGVQIDYGTVTADRPPTTLCRRLINIYHTLMHLFVDWYWPSDIAEQPWWQATFISKGTYVFLETPFKLGIYYFNVL